MLERCAQTGQMRDLDAERVTYDHKWAEVYKAAENQRLATIARLCAQHELESDEFQTAEQKAQRYL